MGKVRPEIIKRTSRNLYSRYPNYFGTEFQDNKEKLREILPTSPKSVRNRVAGYVTRVAKFKAKESETEEKPADEQETQEESG